MNFKKIPSLSYLPVTMAAIDIYSHFAVPLFFVISGLVLGMKYTADYSVKTFYQKRLNRIMIPYLIWSVIYISIDFSAQNNTSDYVFMLLTGNAYYHLWFFFLIFQFYLIFPFYRKLIKGKSFRFILFILIIQIAFNHFNDGLFVNEKIQLILNRLFLAHIFNFSLGIWIADNVAKVESFLSGFKTGKNILLLIVSVSASLLFSYNWLGEYNQFFDVNNLFLFIEHVFIPLIFVMIFINLNFIAGKIRSSGHERFLTPLSDYSFGVYLSHALILRIIAKILGYLNINYNYLSFYILSFIFTIILSVLFCYVVEKIRLSRYLISFERKTISL